MIIDDEDYGPFRTQEKAQKYADEQNAKLKAEIHARIERFKILTDLREAKLNEN